MSGLYNLVMGDGKEADRGTILLAALGNPNVARYRDAWVENYDGEPVIAIYTRQGGGNRECYCEAEPCECGSAVSNADLQAHPLYLRDADDDFDSTYATFYFRCPPEHREHLRNPEVMQEPVNMSERWQAMIDSIGKASA
jgi:hypothetical protein